MNESDHSLPLRGITVVEFAAIGPAPFCCMLLSDMGARIIRIDRTHSVDLGVNQNRQFDLLNRGRESIALDLKSAQGIEISKRLLRHADVLVEGFRPGVLERLGLGPEDCRELNPGLVYGRMTGWGQSGPVAAQAGHDINYIALSGALNAIGEKNRKPVPPLNLVADFGGGALYLAFGILCALMERQQSGQGQVVDAAMVDGVNSLLTGIRGLLQSAQWTIDRGDNILDGGAPYYDVYETADQRYLSVGAIENRFFRELIDILGLAPAYTDKQNDRGAWPEMRKSISEKIKSRDLQYWKAKFADSDACVFPVLDFNEVTEHPHHQARGNFQSIDGALHPSPAPRLSRTPARIQSGPALPGQHSLEILRELGYTAAQINTLINNDTVSTGS